MLLVFAAVFAYGLALSAAQKYIQARLRSLASKKPAQSPKADPQP
jgi:hypothetical protein